MKYCYTKCDLPLLEKPVFVRVRFSKLGSLQFISHLDLHRTINRAIIRAGIPVWYTQGFNPHTKLVFATPLSVGTQSLCEYLDIRIDREITPEEIKNRLNSELPDEIRILDAYFPDTEFSNIIWSSYTIKIYSCPPTKNSLSAINELFSRQEILMLKRSKAGDKNVNIIPYIKRLTVDAEDDITVIRAVLSANSQNYLNPEYLIGAIKSETDILSAEPTENLYTIIRNSALTEDGETEFR